MIGWRSSIPLTVFLAGSAMPAAVPVQFSVGPVQVYLFEPFLAVAILYAAKRLERSPNPPRIGPLAVVIVAAAAHGLFRGHMQPDVIFDARGLAILLAVTFVASRVASDGTLIPACLRALRWSLWWSATLHFLASTGALELSGRQEFVAGTDVSRVLSPATHVGLAVLCGTVTLLLTGSATLRKTALYLLPAAYLVFTGFSRNAILALAVAIIFAVLFNRTGKLALGLMRVSFVSFTLVILALSAQAFLGVQPPERLTTELTAFQERVLSGLSSEARAEDSSALYRVEENGYMRRAIEASPTFGHGLGFRYKPAYGPADSFTYTRGPLYGHNFYYWITVKTGVIGFLAFVWLILPVVAAAAVRVTGTAHVTLGGVLAAFLVISVVIPAPMSASDSAVLMGCLIGFTAGLRKVAPTREKAERRRPVPQGSRWV